MSAALKLHTEKNPTVWKVIRNSGNNNFEELDYYPFGQLMEGRSGGTSDYRYGMNGQEHENEITNSQSHYSAEYWMYDARLGRRWDVDPLADQFPWQSPYCAFDNNPINKIDPDGRAAVAPTDPPGTGNNQASSTASTGGIVPGTDLGEQIMNTVKGVQFNAYGSSPVEDGVSDNSSKDGFVLNATTVETVDNSNTSGNVNIPNTTGNNTVREQKWGIYGGGGFDDFPEKGDNFVLLHAQAGNYKKYRIFGGRRQDRSVEPPARAQYRKVRKADNYNVRNDLHYGDQGYKDIVQARDNMHGVWMVYNSEKFITDLSDKKVNNYNRIMANYNWEKFTTILGSPNAIQIISNALRR